MLNAFNAIAAELNRKAIRRDGQEAWIIGRGSNGAIWVEGKYRIYQVNDNGKVLNFEERDNNGDIIRFG